MSLTFEVPAASEGEAYENLGRVSALEQMLYANYSEVGSATTISQAPLVRMKVMNLAQKGTKASATVEALKSVGPIQPRVVLYESYKTDSSPSSGLLGIIDNLSVNHNISGDDGVFHKMRPIRNDEGQVIGQEPVPNTILPKNIELSLAFSPIHETTLGWNKYDTQINNLFPYGVVTDDIAPDFTRLLDEDYSAYNVQAAKEKPIRYSPSSGNKHRQCDGKIQWNAWGHEDALRCTEVWKRQRKGFCQTRKLCQRITRRGSNGPGL